MSIETTSEARLIGTVTGGYRVLSRIGSGTMGHVYEAEDVSVGKRVALKVLHRSRQKELAARFLREGKTLALLSHPNIVQLADMGQLDDGTLFLATELIAGNSLRGVMDRGPIELRRALQMMRQLLDALDAAHALGVVHRDIKPENVMVTEDDFIKVLDFGVAKLLADTVAGLGEANLTSIGFSIFGSALYIAPESVTGQKVDARIDLYSTGAVLFEMIAGRPPFDHEDPAVLLQQQAFEPAPTLKQVAPSQTFAPELEALVARALAKQPDDRFRSAADMIVALDAALHVLERQANAVPAAVQARNAAATPTPAINERRNVAATPTSAIDERRARTDVVRVSRRSRRRQLVIGSAVAAVLLLVIVFATRRGKGDATEHPSAGALASRATTLVRAGSNQEAVELLEGKLAGPTKTDQGAAYLMLGHAQFALAHVQQALAAYERALRAAPALAADKELRENLVKVLESKDVLATILALELLASLTPPEHSSIVAYGSTGKLLDARHRAIMLAERDGFADKLDRVQSWTLDLQQASTCEERKDTIELLARTSDRRALAALKRARSVKCIEREATEAIARIEATAK